MVDLHSHILPGMDDGSASVEESVALLRLLEQQGVQTVAATPHFYATQEDPESFLKRRAAALEQLQQAWDGNVQILPGAEVAYFEGMENCQELVQLQIGQTGLLLVEMPFDAWEEHLIRSICTVSVQLGVTVVLAHADRYNRRDQMKRYGALLASQGGSLQCNAEAFLGRWSRRWPLQLVKQGKVAFLGSDCHNLQTRPPQLDKALVVLEKRLGRDALQTLLAAAEKALG